MHVQGLMMFANQALPIRIAPAIRVLGVRARAEVTRAAIEEKARFHGTDGVVTPGISVGAIADGDTVRFDVPRWAGILGVHTPKQNAEQKRQRCPKASHHGSVAGKWRMKAQAIFDCRVSSGVGESYFKSIQEQPASN